MSRIYKIIILCLLSFAMMLPISRVNATSFSPRLSAPSTSDYHYYSDNIFYKSGFGMPNCTAYAWGRAYEILGYKPNLSINGARKWWNYNINSRAFSYGSSPRIGSIMCWNGGSGHVAVVEKLSGNNMTISESSYGGFNFRTKSNTISNIQNLNSGFQGYIYLGNFDTNVKPGKPTLTVQAGDSITNTTFSWNATSNTHHYDLRIYNSAGTTILYKQYLTSRSFSYALPAGSYSADVASVGNDNNNYTFGNRVSFTVKVKPSKPTLKVSPGSNTYKTVFNWDKTSNTHHYDLRIYNSSTKKEYKSVYNLESNSYSIVLPIGSYYANVASVVKDCSSYTFSTDVSFTIEKDPIQSSDGWYYVDRLPSYVDSSQYIIQYDNTTEKVANSSPGSDYKKGALVKSQYENYGNSYWSKIELPTSNTRVLVSYSYYHYCGGNTGVYANYELSGNYVHEDTISNVSSVYIDSSGPDSDNPSYKYYKLRWSNGNLAYCNSNTTCNGSHGSHGNRSYIWYRNSQYQNKVKVDYYKYTKESGWVSSKDSSATSVKYRYKPKTITKPITSITLNTTNQTINKGSSFTLKATINPSDTTDSKTLTWITSNSKVATVENGVVKAIGAGTATITVKTSNGKIATCQVTVKEGGSISTQDITTKKNQTISIPVYIQNNPGIIGLKMEMKYDSSKLQLLGVEDHKLLSVPVMSEDLKSNPYILSWGDGLLDKNNTSTGKLVTVKFKVLDVSTCNTTVTFKPTEAYGTDLEKNISFLETKSTVKINNRLVGDVNGDGEVKLNDALLLRRYIANNSIKIVKENADVNSDGEIKLNDALLLRRYTAGWKVELK